VLDSKVLEFLEEYDVKYYSIRDKSKNGGKAFHIVEKDDVLNKIKIYDGAFSVHVSSFNYKDNQVVLGEILISDTNVFAILSTNGEFSIRDVYKHPDICVNASIFDDKEINKIPHFNDIYKYILDNNFKNVIVEFGYFDIPVGINNENMIIYEIRTDY